MAQRTGDGIMDVKVNDPIRHETMRINGQAVDAEGRIDVLNP